MGVDYYTCANDCEEIVNDSGDAYVEVNKPNGKDIAGYVCDGCYRSISDECVPNESNVDYIIASELKCVSLEDLHHLIHLPQDVIRVIHDYQLKRGFFFLRNITLFSIQELLKFVWRARRVAHESTEGHVILPNEDEMYYERMWDTITASANIDHWWMPEEWYSEFLSNVNRPKRCTEFFEAPLYDPPHPSEDLRKQIAQLEAKLARKRKRLEMEENDEEFHEDAQFRRWV